jgi:hypothetical protein
MSEITPDRRPGGRSQGPDTPPGERALAGLGTFSWKIAVGTVLAALLALAALKLMGRGGEERPLVAPSARGTSGAASPSPVESAAEIAEVAASPVAGEVERRRAAGELQQAVKRFAPCPGGDVRRTAWIDGDRIVKLARQRADGVAVEEWFDHEGRLREALVRGPSSGAPSSRRLVLDEAGRTLLDAREPPGAAGAAAATLDRQDPSAAFFAGPGCGR